MKPLFRRLSRILAAVVCMGCMALMTSGALAAGDPILQEDILNAVETAYKGKSFEADFTQVSTLAALEIVETASGKAAFTHPGKMRWTYTEPEFHEIITNGVSLWIYRPDENQVMTGNAAGFFKSGAGGAFLSDISQIRKNYHIELKETDDRFALIELVPKKQTPDIASIQIRVVRQTGEIIEVTTVNPYDDTTLFEFTNIRFRDLSADLFEFDPPPGVNIINMN